MEPIKLPSSELMHYGILRRSGRYPWGSGGNAEQNAKSFKTLLDQLRKGDPEKGIPPMTDPQIAEHFHIKTNDLRDLISRAREDSFRANQAMAIRLKDKGMSTRAISERMLGSPTKESTVRGWLSKADEVRDDSLAAIAGVLRGRFGTDRWLDVGKGTEIYMGISDVRLRGAVAILKDEGYRTHSIKLNQLGTNKPTEYKILGRPNSTWGEARKALLAGEVPIITERSDDGGLTFMKPKPEPVSVNSKRIAVRYKEDGGEDMDGVIELRRGVPDLSLGAKRYAQVRVAVDGTHYLKGMAIYSDDLPEGTDIRFNTNKSDTGNKLDAMKPLDLGEHAAGNRFGAQIKDYPMVYKDAKGKVQTSPLNVVNEEGDWDLWSRNLSSQMLSKQSLNLASSQLKLARSQKQEKLDKIMALTNPVVKKQLLLDFADSADSAAVHLKAAALPNQSTHVILPMNSMRPNEIYAPKFDNGTKVALVRYPHGGPFEIPQLTVNNNNRTAKRIMGSNATDAVGIHHSVAAQLSGADFDGDSVLVIPNDDNRIKSKPPLEELKNFDPKTAYPEAPGMTYMTKRNTQKEMGKVSNLITDMTIKGARTDEIARAVKHSMVVIDAEKHKLDYKQSEKDNGIAQLKRDYQGGPTKGASTIISRSGRIIRPPQFRERKASEGGKFNPETGAKEFIVTGNTYPEKKKNPVTGKLEPTGVIKTSVTKIKEGAYVTDARTLSSGQPIENVYATHANALKDMANTARKEYLSIQDPPRSPAAKAYYSKEVESLKTKLQKALMNAPLERRAQAIATATSQARIDNTPDLDDDKIKKIRYQSLTDARATTGAAKARIGSETNPITEKEWYAIQSGAVSTTMLKEILYNSDMDAIQDLATPQNRTSLTTGQLALAKTMSNSGRSLAEIAAALGIPKSTIADNLARS